MNINNDAILTKMAAKQMSRQDLAEKSGIKYAALTEAMRRKRMTTEKIGKVAHALGCEVEEIISI